jgi:tritrans,polycis-undecaprenyl-diphosphate synthase [geranylgeranyl-diphosphate specific]
MDGNRRFAERFGLKAWKGHQKGREKIDDVLDWTLELDIKVFTVYALSSENLTRDSDEVDHLMDIFRQGFLDTAEDPRVHKNHIRVRALGDYSILPDRVVEAIELAQERTKDYHSYNFNVAVAYGGRQEIIRAIKTIAQDARDGKIEVEDISEETVSGHLYTKDIPDPDLILRTSGEERISNFLLWQLAYSELYFTDVYWPGFRKVDFLRAIRSYQKRKRRYGN